MTSTARQGTGVPGLDALIPSRLAPERFYCQIHMRYISELGAEIHVFDPLTQRNHAVCPLCFAEETNGVIETVERVVEDSEDDDTELGCLQCSSDAAGVCTLCNEFRCADCMSVRYPNLCIYCENEMGGLD